MTDIAPAIRQALIENTCISSLLSNYGGSSAILTRRPTPENISYPCIVIPFVAAVTNQDFLVERIDVIIQDIMVYGRVASPGTSNDHTRLVDGIAYELRQMFHRNRTVLGNTPYHVIDIVASGPTTAPVDDDKTVGRRVTLTLRIQHGS